MYNPLIHHRKSNRLQGYDYAREGLYFITLNTESRMPLFGEIIDGVMYLNDAGEVAHGCWLAIPEHFPHAEIHEFVIMPDHIHGVIEILFHPIVNPVGVKNFSPRLDERNRTTAFKSPSKTIGSIVRGFKIGVTKWMRENTTVYKVWQRDYYDHIIRNTESYDRICQYIVDNPKNWKK